MKPKPLYEVIKRWWNEARVLLNPKTEEEFRDEVSNLILLVKRNEKQRVKQLLEEIEKEWGKVFVEMHGYDPESCSYWLCLGEWKGFKIAKDLIKQAFSGVIEE